MKDLRATDSFVSPLQHTPCLDFFRRCRSFRKKGVLMEEPRGETRHFGLLQGDPIVMSRTSFISFWLLGYHWFLLIYGLFNYSIRSLCYVPSNELNCRLL